MKRKKGAKAYMRSPQALKKFTLGKAPKPVAAGSKSVLKPRD
jgi:hypothetical protein